MNTIETTETINLGPIWSIQRSIEADVARSEQILALKNQQLKSFNQRNKEEIRKSLDLGRTTGDPLLDQLLRYFGLDRPKINAVMVWNQRMIDGAGQEMLILIPYLQQVNWQLTPIEALGKIYGILSGDPLEVKTTFQGDVLTEICLTVPFSRFTLKNFQNVREPKILTRKLTLGAQEFDNTEPNPRTILSTMVSQKTIVDELGALSKNESIICLGDSQKINEFALELQAVIDNDVIEPTKLLQGA